jgi:alkanesulfonate monooxygenase SsuD/methylene tetrahydromethanopterin reductase-like flavin-dependent oxidoreductase (luciferase family)
MSDTRFWRMGATPAPATEIGRIASALEGSGWDGLAIGEAHGLLPDPYVLLGLAADATTSLGIGTAVAVPLRHPLLAADAMATVQAVSDGRSRLVARSWRRSDEGASARADAGCCV